MKEEFEKKLISLISVEMFDNKKALFDELVIWFEQKLSSEYQRGVEYGQAIEQAENGMNESVFKENLEAEYQRGIEDCIKILDKRASEVRRYLLPDSNANEALNDLQKQTKYFIQSKLKESE